MTLTELIKELSTKRDELLSSPLELADKGGISYRLQQPELEHVRRNSTFDYALRERLNLHRHAAIALLQTAEVNNLEQLKARILRAQIFKPSLLTRIWTGFKSLIQSVLRRDNDVRLDDTESISDITKKALKAKGLNIDVKKALKAAESILMRRKMRAGCLYEKSGGSFSIQVSRVDRIQESALAKGEMAKDRGPRNRRVCKVNSQVGEIQYQNMAYLVEGTDLQVLKESTATPMFEFLKELIEGLDQKAFYSSVLDGDDVPWVKVLNWFKPENELKLQKQAFPNDPQLNWLVRMNTTQKWSIQGAFKNFPLLRLFKANFKFNDALKSRLEQVIQGLEVLPSATPEKEKVKRLLDELKFLKWALEQVENGRVDEAQRWKPVLEQMIAARTGALCIMGCKSGKDRAFAVTSLTMAMERRMIELEGFANFNFSRDQTLAGYLLENYKSDYGAIVGADNCDGAYGTKHPERFFPSTLYRCLTPDQKQELDIHCKQSHQRASINEIASMPRAAIAEAKLTVNQASVQADSLSPSGPNDQTSLAHLNQNQANGADLIVTSPITPHKVNDP
jgi:hypothetical protein